MSFIIHLKSYWIIYVVIFISVFSAVMIVLPKSKAKNIFANIWFTICGFTMGFATIQFVGFSWFSAIGLFVGIYFLVKTILVSKKEYIDGEDEF